MPGRSNVVCSGPSNTRSPGDDLIGVGGSASAFRSSIVTVGESFPAMKA